MPNPFPTDHTFYFISLSLSLSHSHSTWKPGYVSLSEFFYSQGFCFPFFSFPLMPVFSNQKNLCLWISVENIFTIATILHYILRFARLCALVISIHFLMFLHYLIDDCILGLSKLNLQLPYDVWEIAQGLWVPIYVSLGTNENNFISLSHLMAKNKNKNS